jgi:proteic killer suppression protein
MVKTIKHRGLRRLYEDNDSSGVLSQYVAKIRRILLALDNAEDIRALDLPGFRLHPLKGDLVGFWSVTVSGNWRIIFRFEQGDAFDVDLVDYH